MIYSIMRLIEYSVCVCMWAFVTGRGRKRERREKREGKREREKEGGTVKEGEREFWEILIGSVTYPKGRRLSRVKRETMGKV